MQLFVSYITLLLGFFGWQTLNQNIRIQSPPIFNELPQIFPDVWQEPRWKLDLSGFDNLTPGDTSQVIFKIKGLVVSPATKITLRMPIGPTVVSGDTFSTHSFTVNDSILISYYLSIPDTGRYEFHFVVQTDTFRVDTMQAQIKSLYIIIQGDSILADTTCGDSSKVATFYDSGPGDTLDTLSLMSSGGDATIYGSFFFKNVLNGNSYPCPGLLVRFERGLYYYLDTTNANGEYSINVPSGYAYTVKALRENVTAYHQNHRSPLFYWLWKGSTSQLAPSQTYSMGNQECIPSAVAATFEKCYYGYKIIKDSFEYIPDVKVKIKWPDEDNDVVDKNGNVLAHYNEYTNHIGIPQGEWAYNWVPAHEWGHWIDDEMYGSSKMGAGGSINVSHGPYSQSDPPTALSEGWAEFAKDAALSVYPNPYNEEIVHPPEVFPSNNPHWWSKSKQCTDGDSVEGAVRQFFWDLFDSAPENGFDDERFSHNATRMKTIFVNDRPHSVREFINDWNTRYTEANDDLDELDSVIIHSKDDLDKYSVPKPTNFKPGYDFGNDELDLTWTDNTTNEGHFKIKFGSTEYYAGSNSTSLTINTPPQYSSYQKWRIHAVVADTSPADTFLYAPKSYSVGFENVDTRPYENSPWSSNPVNVTGVVAERSSSQYQSGSYSYKFAGNDNSSEGSYAYYNLFKIYSPIFEPDLDGSTQTRFLSAYFKLISSPGSKGHISLEGTLDPWARLESIWDDDYGWVVDQYGQRIKADLHNTLPQGEWKQFVFNLAPAHNHMFNNISLAYNDSLPTETGNFEVYVDGLSLDFSYPHYNEWYVEVFGGDKNARVTWEAQDDQVDLIVEGHGLESGETEGWVGSTVYHHPTIRNTLIPAPLISVNDRFSWSQYDKDHSLLLSINVADEYQGAGKWLTYAANASNHWWRQGFVDMGETQTCYNQWEPFTRNVVQDYNDEFDPDVSSLYIKAIRVGHFAKKEWDGDHGGSIKGISITGTGSGDGLSPYTNLILQTPNGGERWKVGTTHDIVWTYYVSDNTELDGFLVQICTDYGSGNTWRSIGYVSYGGSSAAYAYPWPIPSNETPSKNCRARVVAVGKNEGGSCILMPLGGDMSNANFEIYKLFIGPSPEPFVWPPELCEHEICSSPMISGGNFEIGWISDGVNPVSSVTLQYSLNGGSTYQNIATGLNPGDSVVFDSCEVDSEMVYYTGLHDTYTWTIPSTPTCGGKFRYVAYDTTGDSASYVFGETFTIPFGSGSLYSTALTANKLASGSSKTGMVYTNSTNSVIYSESQNGYEWDTIMTVATMGVLPSLSVVNDTPYVSWRSTSTSNQALYGAKWPDWSASTIIPQALQGVQFLSEPATFALGDSSYTSMFVVKGSTEQNLTSLNLVSKHAVLSGSGVHDTVYQTTNPVSYITKAPAMVVDNEYNGYYAFIYNGMTVFIYDRGGSMQMDTITSTSRGWPSLDISGSNVYLTYATVVGSDTVLIRKWMYAGDTVTSFWRGTDTLYKGPLTDLSTAGGIYCILTDPANNMKRITFNPVTRETNTIAALADSIYYPHIGISRLSGRDVVLQWTEQVGSNYYIMSEREEADAILPHVYLEGGTTTPSPLCTYRDRACEYGDYTVDFDSDSLKYTLENLNTSLDYKLLFELYYDDTVASRDYIVTVSSSAGTQVDTITVSDDSLTTYIMAIDTLDTTLAVKIAADDVGLVRMILYEDEGTQGGFFSASHDKNKEKLPLKFALESIAPTPFTDKARVCFALPMNEYVTLKVYDVAGREIRSLLVGQVEAGVHTLYWDGKDNMARKVSSGVYFVRLETSSFQASRKTVRLK